MSGLSKLLKKSFVDFEYCFGFQSEFKRFQERYQLLAVNQFDGWGTVTRRFTSCIN